MATVVFTVTEAHYAIFDPKGDLNLSLIWMVMGVAFSMYPFMASAIKQLNSRLFSSYFNLHVHATAIVSKPKAVNLNKRVDSKKVWKI